MKNSIRNPSACVAALLVTAILPGLNAGEILGIVGPISRDHPVKIDPVQLRAPEEVVLPSRFIRGDSDGSGTVNLTDGLTTLSSLFLGETALTCLDAADANDDGEIGISDAIHTFRFLFVGDATMASPHPECGVDGGGGSLGCEASEACDPYREEELYQYTQVEGGFLIDLHPLLVVVLPDGVACRLGSTSPRSVATSGILHKLSPSTIFIETESTSFRRAGGLRLGIVVEGSIAAPPLGFTCSSFACICSGETHCDALSQTGNCGVQMVTIEDEFGHHMSVCKR